MQFLGFMTHAKRGSRQSAEFPGAVGGVGGDFPPTFRPRAPGRQSLFRRLPRLRALAAAALLAGACVGDGDGGSLYGCGGPVLGGGVGTDAAAIEVLSPGGDEYLAGEPVIVTWRTTGAIDRVDVELLRDGEPALTVARDLDDAGALEWIAPLDLAPGDGWQVRVSDAGGRAAGDSEPFALRNWRYVRAVRIAAPGATAVADAPVLVELSAGAFDFAHAARDGADVRFATRSDRATGYDLPHYVEQWSATGGARVWVRMPSVPAGGVTAYMFYGASGAPDRSDLDAVLPDRYESTGDLTLGGVKHLDVFTLRAGDTLSVTPGEPLEIDAAIIAIDGTIDADGAGHPGGAIGYAGSGAGAGGFSSGGGGGGGYGGDGGWGGFQYGTFPGPGGSEHGTESGADIDGGSGGGGSFEVVGGSGGGAVTLDAYALRVGGAVSADGQPGAGSYEGCCGGGGAGGGILLRAHDLAVTGALSARGGGGGNGGVYDDGGGGGGGGRIKLLYSGQLDYTGVAAVTGGSRGTGGGYGAESGDGGTVYMAQVAGTRPAAQLGAETLLFP